MNKLTKPYKVIYKENELIIPLRKQPDNNDCYPGEGTSFEEFDTYEEAKKYIDKHGLVYLGPTGE